MGRRVRKRVETYNGSSWPETSDELFVYDGWTLDTPRLAERDGLQGSPGGSPVTASQGWNVVLVLDGNNVTQRRYAWGLALDTRQPALRAGLLGNPQASPVAASQGLDLSRTIHGAGGIGGLLAAFIPGGEDDVRLWYFYDGNGNVGQMLYASNTSIITVAARYEYDPYGSVVGPDPDNDGDWQEHATAFALANPIRFSTKWFDAETTLGYWGYRYYSHRLGRWISRDPMGELGGLNSFSLAANGAVNATDALGLIAWQLDVVTCTETMTVKVQLDFRDVLGRPGWTEARKLIFQNLLEMHVRKAFSAHAFRVYPNPAGRAFLVSPGVRTTVTSSMLVCDCPCRLNGWHPRLEVTFGWLWEDFLIHVDANPDRFFQRSAAQLGGPEAWLDEADVYPRATGAGPSQIPAVHEFGHLLGLNHPGQDLAPPAQPNSPPDYAADNPALMGAGMEMRAAYFSKWEDELDDQYKGCRWHFTR